MEKKITNATVAVSMMSLNPGGLQKVATIRLFTEGDPAGTRLMPVNSSEQVKECQVVLDQMRADGVDVYVF